MSQDNTVAYSDPGPEQSALGLALAEAIGEEADPPVAPSVEHPLEEVPTPSGPPPGEGEADNRRLDVVEERQIAIDRRLSELEAGITAAGSAGSAAVFRDGWRGVADRALRAARRAAPRAWANAPRTVLVAAASVLAAVVVAQVAGQVARSVLNDWTELPRVAVLAAGLALAARFVPRAPSIGASRVRVQIERGVRAKGVSRRAFRNLAPDVRKVFGLWLYERGNAAFAERFPGGVEVSIRVYARMGTNGEPAMYAVQPIGDTCSVVIAAALRGPSLRTPAEILSDAEFVAQHLAATPDTSGIARALPSDPIVRE